MNHSPETLTLTLGNKNYSSWSLRAWLSLKFAELEFNEVVIPFDGPAGTKTRAIVDASPSQLVPLLKHGHALIWDSLAIAEYANELRPEAELWPRDRTARSLARSIACEMHSGFTSLRAQMPMNVRREPSFLSPTPETLRDVQRIVEIWSTCRTRFGSNGPFLFGKRSIADASFAPVVIRFATYKVDVDENARAYMKAISELDEMKEWNKAAKEEPWSVERYER